MSASVLGALVPDAIDKTLAWVLQVAPAARHIAHTPLAAALLTTGASAVLGRRKGAAFGAAYLTHLIADLWEGGHVPWLMPFKRYDVKGEPWDVRLSPSALLLEAIGAATIVLLMKNHAEHDTLVDAS